MRDDDHEPGRLRPIRVQGKILRSENDDAPAVAVVDGFGKVGVVAGPALVFKRGVLKPQPYAVNLDKLLATPDNSGHENDPNSGSDGAPPA